MTTPQETSPLRFEAEAAAFLRKPPLTLKHWRQKGYGPRWARIGTRVVYRQDDLEAWLAEQFEGGEAA